mgnify:CR=1 FL=1
MNFVEFMRKVDGREAPKFTRKTSDTEYARVHVQNLEHCQETLYVGSDYLLRAFTWASTPQGHDYWCDIQHGHTELGPGDREFIQGLIDYTDSIVQGDEGDWEELVSF